MSSRIATGKANKIQIKELPAVGGHKERKVKKTGHSRTGRPSKRKGRKPMTMGAQMPMAKNRKLAASGKKHKGGKKKGNWSCQKKKSRLEQSSRKTDHL